MARPPSPDHPPCPHCGAVHVAKAGHTPSGQPRWPCRGCGKPCGPTLGTPLDRRHPPAAEVARSLLGVLRRGRLSAAAALTGHQDETRGRWRRAAAVHADALTAALVHDRQRTAVAVDAFWSFVQRSVATLE